MHYLFLFLFSLSSFASIVPTNNLYIPATVKSSSMDEKRFNAIIDKVTLPYKEIILKHYGAAEFNVFKEWENGKVNAAARITKGRYEMIVYGGLARTPELTADGLKLIICHELGHLIGGAPTWKPLNISSSEGQADYFSTSKCFRKITAKDNNIAKVKNLRIDPTAKVKCDEVYKKKELKAQCYRSSMAQLSVGKLLKSLSGINYDLRLDTPDSNERRLIIFNGYPSPQCRLDTLFAGSLCDKDANELLDMELYNKGNCHRFEKREYGLRPRCWYAPREDKKL